MSSKNYQFATADERIQKEIDQRGNRGSLVVKGLVENYFNWLWPALFKSAQITKEEFLALCDLFNGTLIEPSISPRASLRMNVLDAGQDGYGEKWGCNWEELTKKTYVWDDATSFSVLDGIQKFWNASESYNIPDLEAQLKAIGVFDLLCFEQSYGDD